MQLRKIFTLLLIVFLVNAPIAYAQGVPPDVGNSQVLKASGAPFKEGWNYFTLGFNDCTAKNVLEELQADGGAALKVNELYTKEVFNWELYSYSNPKSSEKKIGSNQTLAFSSNQNFYLEMDQKICQFPDPKRQEQIKEVREGKTSQSSFVEKVRDLPADLWTKLTDLLNKEEASLLQNTNISGKQTFENLTIGGKTTVNDLGITGKISAGLLSISGLDQTLQSPTINALGKDLYFQSFGTGGINILNGKVTIDKDGNLKAQKLNIDTSNPASSALGRGAIPAGQTSITISTTVVTPASMVFVTLETTNNTPLAVTEKISGQSFKVELPTPAPKDLKFNWWIVN